MTPDCAGCTQPIEGEGWDPGHSYGCTMRSAFEMRCHYIYCTESCYYRALERQDEARQRREA